MNIFNKNKKIIRLSFIFCLAFLLVSSFAFLSVNAQNNSPFYANPTQGSVVSGSNAVNGGGATKTPKTFSDLIMNTIIGGMLRPIIALIVSAAIVVFLLGVFKFIRSEGKEKEAGKQFMTWGIVGIFVMVSVWGLVNILRGTFNLNDSQLEISNVIPNL
ncbi:MAG: hypothetical protein WC229_02540 [Candidatus Paceibacterota bacterium]|jgi:hypothetical protein